MVNFSDADKLTRGNKESEELLFLPFDIIIVRVLLSLASLAFLIIILRMIYLWTHKCHKKCATHRLQQCRKAPTVEVEVETWV